MGGSRHTQKDYREESPALAEISNQRQTLQIPFMSGRRVHEPVAIGARIDVLVQNSVMSSFR